MLVLLNPIFIAPILYPLSPNRDLCVLDMLAWLTLVSLLFAAISILML